MKNDSIALINPPAPFLIKERVFPNLGILNVATDLKQHGYNIFVYDLSGIPNSSEQIRDIAKKHNYIGFSSTSPQFIETYKLFKDAKEENPQATYFIGGAHASAVSSFRNRSTLEQISMDPNVAPLEEFDIIFEGEGENIGEEIFKKGDKWRKSNLMRNINDSPIPDRSFIDILSYEYLLKGEKTTTIMSQRGCPYSCVFCCGRDIDMYRIARSNSPERVLEELDYLNSEFGFKSFMWFDDEVNVNPKRLEKLSRLLQKKDYQHRGFVRSDLVLRFPDTVKQLKDAGFVELCSGVESGSNEILKKIKKQTTYEINLEAAHMIKNENITYKGFTIIGHPGETLKDIETTKKWIREADPDGFDISILTPYPGSKIYDEAIPSSKFKGYEWENNGLYFNKVNYSKEESFYKGKPGEYHCHVRTDELSASDLIKIRDSIEKDLKKS